MVRNILPPGIQCIFVRQKEQLGLGHAVLCAERAVGGDDFAVILADDFLTDYKPGVTADLISAYEKSGKSQISVLEVNGPDISKYGVVIPATESSKILGLIEKPNLNEVPSNLASIGRYVLSSDIFEILSGLTKGSGGEIQLSDAINIMAQRGSVEAVQLKGNRFDCGSVDGFLKAIFHCADQLKV